MNADDPSDQIPMSDSLRALARRAAVRRLPKGAQIITEGEFGDTLYIVLKGRLRAFSANADGQEIEFGTYGPGEFVGEMGLDGGPRSANVQTIEPTLCAVVHRATLDDHLRDDPRFAVELLAKVTRLARTATVSLTQIALNNVYGRLKALIDSHAHVQPDGRRTWEDMPSQAELARRIVCTPGMVNKVLKSLLVGHYIELEGRRLVLHRALPAKW